jgi:hypothetical protein
MNRTKPFLMSAAALGLALLVSAPVYAQQPPAAGAGGGQGRQRGGGGRAVTLATVPIAALDSVVTLTAEQKTKLGDLRKTYRTDRQAAQGDQQKMRELTTKMNDDSKAVLNADQNKKWTDAAPTISLLNRSGAVPIAVLADVKLTADQWTKLGAAAKDTNDKIQAIPQADRRTQSPALVTAFKTTADGILTDDQKKTVEKAPKPAVPGAPAAPAA